MCLQRLNQHQLAVVVEHRRVDVVVRQMAAAIVRIVADEHIARPPVIVLEELQPVANRQLRDEHQMRRTDRHAGERSEEYTSELQSLMRTSYAVFCLKKKY